MLGRHGRARISRQTSRPGKAPPRSGRTWVYRTARNSLAAPRPHAPAQEASARQATTACRPTCPSTSPAWCGRTVPSTRWQAHAAVISTACTPAERRCVSTRPTESGAADSRCAHCPACTRTHPIGAIPDQAALGRYPALNAPPSLAMHLPIPRTSSLTWQRYGPRPPCHSSHTPRGCSPPAPRYSTRS